MRPRISHFLFILFSTFFSRALADDSPKDINYWCNTTPHPESCQFYMGGSDLPVPKERSEFRTMLVQVALEQALEAQKKGTELEPYAHSKRKKAAWIDCSKLYNDTILQLNRTHNGLQTNTSMTSFDAQTWLSTALTNLETCRLGSHEMNVSSFISTILSNNVSELISNSLAINENLLEPQDTEEGEYPNWLSKKERRLLLGSSWAWKANYIVAKDRSGNFRSIQAAINYAVSRRKGNDRIVIRVKKGVYRENIWISNTMSKITLVGDGLRYTIITGSRSVSSGFTTYNSATVGVDGPGFIARGITFRNTAGPQRGQAVALRSASDLSVFYACSFEGYQDTLFVHAQRQFFKLCYIYGTIDFIFGNAAVVFQNSMIYVRKPLWGQANIITAQGRADPFQNTGISIQGCRIMAAPDLAPVAKAYKTYLGRPWQQYSRTVVFKSYIGNLVSPVGWSAWENSKFAQNTVFYGEYMNFGPGAELSKRVRWKGFHVIKTPKVASQFTVTNLITGGAWLPATGVPFTSGL